MAGQISGLAVAYTTAGLVLVLSGVRNDSVAGTLKALFSGQVPANNPTGPIQIGIQDNQASGSGASAVGSAGFASGSAIASDALKYVGHCYSYGGAPGPSGQGCWDCSSCCSWILGHDFGLAIPGGSWASVTSNGNVHGPATGDYLTWSGATTIGNNPAQAQAGDLCVWQTHMGICVGGGQMVSALNSSLGTRQTPISGQVTGEILFVRRLKSAPTGKISAISQGPGFG